MSPRSSRTHLAWQLILLLVLGGSFQRTFAARVSEPVRATPGPAVGSTLPNPLNAARMRNAPVEEPAPKSGWVIYAFSPGCTRCARNSERVEELAKSLPADWTLLAWATDEEGLPALLERLHVTVPVLFQVSKEATASYRISSLPRTYILDKDWRLLEVLDGAFEGEVAKRLAARFKVKISPLESSKKAGLAPAPPAAPARAPEDPLRALCFDRQQHPYSRGAKAPVLGLTFQCAAGGVWVPAA